MQQFLRKLVDEQGLDIFKQEYYTDMSKQLSDAFEINLAEKVLKQEQRLKV